MNPDIWGPGAWTFLHTITLNYPKNPNQDIINSHKYFFTLLKDVIPCDKCRLHYSEYLNNNPIDNVLNNKKDFILWLNNLHNIINERNNKPIMSFNEMIKLYKYKYSNNYYHKYFFILFLIVILILFYWLFIK